ncbi:MAG TPA: hypothetical protein VET48_00775 [Steroidobacteraceae bacterium]|nr:hypothetical protein [Steroidobacteraceae bacterium]
MELTQLIFTGALAAVLANVFNAIVLPSLTRLREKSRDAWREPSGTAQFATLSVHLCAGVGLGVLFWLTWGLAAVVGVPWWLRGVLFGTAIWCAICLPLLAMQLIALRTHWSIAVYNAIEWLITLNAAGIACGWTWAKGP